MKQKQILYEKLIQYILENQDRFYRVAYSYTRHQEDALDVVQSAVCKALEAYESIQNEDAVKTWFYKILINECLAVQKNENGFCCQTKVRNVRRHILKTKLYRGLKQLKENIQEADL